MDKPSVFRWGILGTGGIAKAFTADVKNLPDQSVVAVGSRTLDSAKSFASAFGVERAHASYEALVADAAVDGIYVSTPHPMHHPNTLLALNAGKAVLVEKPFAMSAQEATEMVSLARKKGLLLMEAMWTRFLPHIAQIRKILAAGTLGKITTVGADHGQAIPVNPKGRMFAPELGGGALLDLGIYPVSFANLVLGTPSKITAVSDRTFTGVDGQTSILLQYTSGAHAVLNTTLDAATPNRAFIVGTEARIEIDRTFYAPTSFTMTAKDGRVLQHFKNDYPGHGLREEAAEFVRCLRAGLKESPLMPLDETVSIMKVLDEVRRQIGLVY